jgi:hypothetical protein
MNEEQRIRMKQKFADAGEQSALRKTNVSSSLSMRDIAEQLWSLLDNIDTLSDICKPTVNNPKAAMAFYNNAMKYAAKRFELLQSDGYKIYTKQEFNALPKSNGGSGEDWKSLS